MSDRVRVVGARRITLVLRHQADQLIIEVSDPDPRPPVWRTLTAKLKADEA
jgi:hypothetical protein